MSRPSEPVETVSTSIDLSFLPSRIIEPLPNVRSIWESAASRAFDLSIDEPSTRRNAVVIAPLLIGPDSEDSNGSTGQCTRFVLGSQYVLRFWPVPFGRWRWPVSEAIGRILNFELAGFGTMPRPHDCPCITGCDSQSGAGG